MIWRCDLNDQYKAYKQEIDEAMQGVLRSGRYILAENVEAFENEFSSYIGCKYGIGVNSGTDALILSLWAFGLREGDEVITTPFTAIATYSAIRHLRLKPVFVDIDPETFLMDLDCLKYVITGRTKAIVPVHLFGNVVDIEKIREIVGPDIFILEDCAQSHGAKIKGVKSGSLGDIGAFSFYPTKNLGGYGDGGMVVTNNKDFADSVRLRRMYGATNNGREFITDGINSRLDELQAAVLRVKLRYLDSMNKRRRELAALYNNLFDKNIIQPQAVNKDVYSVYHVYCALCSMHRDELIAHLENNNIQANIYYPKPLTKQKGHKNTYGNTAIDFCAAEKVSKSILALPFYPEMPEETLVSVANCVNNFFSSFLKPKGNKNNALYP